MTFQKSLQAAVLAAWLLSNGCTTMRELPRTDYASEPQRKGVHVETRDGLSYDFDYATYDPDSLTGYHTRSEVDGPLDEVAVVHVALEDISRMRTRKLDWYRTGLVGGGIIAGIVAIGLARSNNGSTDSSGGADCSRCGIPSAAGH
jgi:hypothetical protein